MASIALTSIGCIIYLALGTVLMRTMFRWRQRERKLDLFFSAKKAQDVRRGERGGPREFFHEGRQNRHVKPTSLKKNSRAQKHTR
jgi:hypothetical protein